MLLVSSELFSDGLMMISESMNFVYWEMLMEFESRVAVIGLELELEKESSLR